MLVLTRKSGEKIRIGKDIIISVVSKIHGPIKLGIEAPRQISVYREEIYYLIKNNNQKALINNKAMIEKLKTKFN